MIRNRIQVESGNYKIGDEIAGTKITGFGKTWTVKKASRSYLSGQLWEPCRCGKEPIYMAGNNMCESCINKNFGEDTEVCYAYLAEEDQVN